MKLKLNIKKFFSRSNSNKDHSMTPSSSSSLPSLTPSSSSILPSTTTTSSSSKPIVFPGSNPRVMKSTERGLRDIYGEERIEEQLILNKSISIRLTPIKKLLSYPPQSAHPLQSILLPPKPIAHPPKPNWPTVNINMTHLFSAIAFSFGLKYHFIFDGHSLNEIYGIIVKSFCKGLHSSDVVPVERFYDCLDYFEVTTSIADSSNDDDTRKHGVVLLVGSLLLISLMIATANYNLKWGLP